MIHAGGGETGGNLELRFELRGIIQSLTKFNPMKRIIFGYLTIVPPVIMGSIIVDPGIMTIIQKLSMVIIPKALTHNLLTNHSL